MTRIIFTIILLILSVIYLKNEGIYLLKKAIYSEVEFINEFCEIDLPITTIIENFQIETDIDTNVFSHNEYLEARIIVPNSMIETLFPKDMREYDLKYVMDLRQNINNEKIWFSSCKYKVTKKWLDKTQRTIYFTVMQPTQEYTRVYVFVDKLGWEVVKRTVPLTSPIT